MNANTWEQVITRAMKDRAFRIRMLADPAATLKESGLTQQDAIAVTIHENTEETVHLVLQTPADTLSDAAPERTEANGPMLHKSKPWTEVIARASRDPAFKKGLLANPVAVLRAAGVAIPDGVAVKVHEKTGTEVHLVLPPLLNADAISDNDLERITAGRKGTQVSLLTSGCGAGVG